MSLEPGPTALSPCRSNFWNGLEGSNTVSIWPISSTRLPRSPLRWATRWPARWTSSMGIQRTVKPSAAKRGESSSATRRTPAGFSVPLLMSTSFSSNALDSARLESMAAVTRLSTSESVAADKASAPAAARTSPAENLMDIGWADDSTSGKDIGLDPDPSSPYNRGAFLTG